MSDISEIKLKQVWEEALVDIELTVGERGI
jgi:hypothetical protein